MAGVAAARVERGVPFKSVKIIAITGAPLTPLWGVRELRKHVSHVGIGFRVRYDIWGDDDDSDEEYREGEGVSGECSKIS